MPQQYKIEKVNYLKKIFEENKDFVFTNYSGLNVEKITQLRNELKKVDSRYVVVKNNFVKVIVKEKEYPDFGDNLTGCTAIAFSKKDANEVARLLYAFKKNTTLKIKGAYIDGSMLNAIQVEDLSKLPGRDQLIAMLMNTMNAPLQNFVFACNDVIGRFVRVINAVKEQKESA